MSNKHQLTILIVDDEKINILSLSSILKGYAKLRFATTAAEALKLADEQHFDLILLDIMLPDISGFDVCRQLKNNPKTLQTPVVFVTALQREEEEAKGLRLGALDYIRKPFNPTIVQARVQNLLNLSQAYRKLEKLSTTDFLTGAYNRRHFVKVVETEMKRQKNITLLLLDIDHFKHVNDTYGHVFGDQALKHLVQICIQQLREVDIFARLGGEEFAVLLLDNNESGAMSVAEKLRSAIAESPLRYNDNMVMFNVSIGVNCQPADKKQDIDTLLDQTDQALYRAKETGRNRSIAFSDCHSNR